MAAHCPPGIGQWFLRVCMILDDRRIHVEGNARSFPGLCGGQARVAMTAHCPPTIGSERLPAVGRELARRRIGLACCATA